jgi:hypothetical protein
MHDPLNVKFPSDIPTKTVCAFQIFTAHAIWSAHLADLHFKQALVSKATSTPSALHTYTYNLTST